MSKELTASRDMREDALRDIGTSFWLRDAIEHLDKLKGRDPVDAATDLDWLSTYVDTLWGEMDEALKPTQQPLGGTLVSYPANQRRVYHKL